MRRTICVYIAALAALLVMAGGCSKKEAPVEEPAAVVDEAAQDSGEAPAGGRTDIDEDVLAKIGKYASEYDSLEGYNDIGERVAYPGVTFMVESDARATRAIKAVRELRRELEGQGYGVFIVDMAFGMGMDRLAVIKSDDRFEILRVMQTGGVNYDVFPKDVQERLREWDERFGIDILGAGFDWAQAEFVNKPDDMDAFAAEVYEFCPDVVEQGSGSVEALAKEMSDTNSVFLWWD